MLEDQRPDSPLDGTATAVRRLRILLVDNDAVMRSRTAESLENAGFDTTSAGTGREALAIADTQSFDLAVLDHGLPDCSGATVAETLQRTRQLPFMFLTSRSDHATITKAAEIGALGYLIKPVDPGALAPMVRVVSARAADRWNALEYERQRLAAELHDGLGQELTGASLMAAAIERQSLRGGSPTLLDLSALRQTIEQALRCCRDLSHRQYAPAVRGGALGDSLRALVDRAGALTNMECVYEGPTAPSPNVSDTVSHNLYRVAQEALRNAIRHSGGSRVTVQLSLSARMVTLSIRDNGRGCRVMNCAESCGIGCLTMRYRALRMGGNIMMRDTRPSGTDVIIEVPL